jgi:hypothetical protein
MLRERKTRGLAGHVHDLAHAVAHAVVETSTAPHFMGQV